MIEPADHKPLHRDASGESDGKSQRQGQQQRQCIIRDEKLHHIAGIGAHHDEFAMRHVDHAHDAKGDGKADGGQEIDRGQRQAVQRQIGGLVQSDLELDRLQRIGGGGGNRGIGFGIEQDKAMRGQGRRLIIQRHERRHGTGRGQGFIRRLARGVRGQACHRNARHAAAIHCGDQSVLDGLGTCQWRRETRLDKAGIGLGLG